MNGTKQIYHVHPRYAWLYRAMGAFSLVVSFFSLYFLKVLFDIIGQFGPLPVPNVPLIAVHILLVFQSIVLVFIAVYFFVRAELRLVVTERELSVLSYWYRLVTSWENIRGITHSSTTGIRLPVLLLQSPGMLEARKRRKGLYSLNRDVIPVGLFSSFANQNEVMAMLQRYAPHIVEGQQDIA